MFVYLSSISAVSPFFICLLFCQEYRSLVTVSIHTHLPGDPAQSIVLRRQLLPVREPLPTRALSAHGGSGNSTWSRIILRTPGGPEHPVLELQQEDFLGFSNPSLNSGLFSRCPVLSVYTGRLFGDPVCPGLEPAEPDRFGPVPGPQLGQVSTGGPLPHRRVCSKTASVTDTADAAAAEVLLHNKSLRGSSLLFIKETKIYHQIKMKTERKKKRKLHLQNKVLLSK